MTTTGVALRSRRGDPWRGVVPMRHHHARGGAPVVDADGYTAALRELVDELETPRGLALLGSAYSINMAHKTEQYRGLVALANEDVAREERIIDDKMPDLRRKADAGPENNWSIFESVSTRYLEARDRVAALELILRDAQRNLDAANDPTRTTQLRDELVRALRALSHFTAQAHVIDAAVHIVTQFVKNPRVVRTKFLNFLLAGAAGTGKTTLVDAVARVFAKAGLFVYDRVRSAGRADLVAEYEGQTVTRTRNYLMASLECTVFIDEAYALTTWSDGKPESYGAEATTALVEHMTRYKGLYALFVAGYEKEMRRYFLPTNPGLSRRFPYRFVMKNLTPDDMIHVFRRALLVEQGLAVPEDRSTTLATERYFTDEAWVWLRQIVQLSLSGTERPADEYEYDAATKRYYPGRREFEPRYPRMYALFEHQAGSMTNLAEEAVTVLSRAVSFQEASAARRRGRLDASLANACETQVMFDVLVARICNSAMSDADAILDDLMTMRRDMARVTNGDSSRSIVYTEHDMDVV